MQKNVILYFLCFFDPAKACCCMSPMPALLHLNVVSEGLDRVHMQIDLKTTATELQTLQTNRDHKRRDLENGEHRTRRS